MVYHSSVDFAVLSVQIFDEKVFGAPAEMFTGNRYLMKLLLVENKLSKALMFSEALIYPTL